MTGKNLRRSLSGIKSPMGTEMEGMFHSQWGHRAGTEGKGCERGQGRGICPPSSACSVAIPTRKRCLPNSILFGAFSDRKPCLYKEKRVYEHSGSSRVTAALFT